MDAFPLAELLVLGLMSIGIGGIFLWLDRHHASSRALGACLAAMGAAIFLTGFEWFGGARVTPVAQLIVDTLIALSILCGIEWGRRIGTGVQGRVARAANVLTRLAQALVLVYWGLGVGYVLLFPELATTDDEGLVAARGVEFAVFGSVLGAAMLFAAVAIALLLFSRHTDPAEAVRLRALVLAAPFLLAGIPLHGTLASLLMTVGLLIYLAGSIRFLIIQRERGQFVARFVSPQLARMARDARADPLRRERRRITLLACDLRGFTAYARKEDSSQVVALLERYYSLVGAVAAQHGGTIKDHAGDGVLVLIGAPLPLPDAESRAAAMALDLRHRVQALIAESGVPLGLGIGVASGEVTIGAVQGAGRLEYVAVGSAVNLAARLCSRAQDGEILLDTDTAQAVGEAIQVAPQTAESLKGYPEPVPVYALRG